MNAIFILIHALKNLKEVVDVFLEVTPKNVDIEEIRKHILGIKGIIDVHHIHIRSLDGFSNIATMHIVLKEYDKNMKKKVKEELTEHGVDHSTIEIELEGEDCNNKECIIKDDQPKHHHHH